MNTVYCLFNDQYEHIRPIESVLAGKVRFIYDKEWEVSGIYNTKPDLVVGINEYHLKVAKCYEAANKLSIPTLTLQDGILEWRYLYENPMFNGNTNGVPLHYPIIADKYACIGPWWLSMIAALGNEDKVELTGMPKMDILGNSLISDAKSTNDTKRIMIITAAKPWFNESQRQVVLKMLRDLKTYFENRSDIEVNWRITKLLDKDLKVKNTFSQKATMELASQLKDCDAVISTTSTAMIESMLMGKPLARLDYFNSPPLYPTVWNITHADQIDNTVNSLLAPTREHCYWQEIFKNQVIGHIGNGTTKVSELILKMIEYTKSNPNQKLPSNILMMNTTVSSTSQNFSEPLFPERESLSNHDMVWLRAKLVRLEHENSTLIHKLSKVKIGDLILSLYKKVINYK